MKTLGEVPLNDRFLNAWLKGIEGGNPIDSYTNSFAGGLYGVPTMPIVVPHPNKINQTVLYHDTYSNSNHMGTVPVLQLDLYKLLYTEIPGVE